MAPRLQAGVARVVITPPSGITYTAWGAMTFARAEGALSDLYATALVVSDGDETAAIVDIDLGGLTEAQSDEIRQTAADLSGIPAEHIRLATTHTHAGPTTGPSWIKEGSELIPGYVGTLAGKIAGAVRVASRNRRPARAAAGRGVAPVNCNRRFRAPDGRIVGGRNWEGFSDREVLVLRIDDEQERPIAVVVNYAAHPTILAHENRFIAPDYVGPLRAVVEREVGGLCLFLQGAAGNQHAFLSYTNSVAAAEWTGRVIGCEAAKVALLTPTLPKRERFVGVIESGISMGIFADEPAGEPDGTVRVITRNVSLPLRDQGDPIALAAEAAEKRERYQRLLAENRDPAAIHEANWRAKRAAMRAMWAQEFAGQTSTSVEFHAIRIGTTAILGIPGEPFAEIGRAIKDQSPFAHTIFGGYANGGKGYIPVRTAYAIGGYEVEWGTPYSPDAADVVIAEAVALLHQLAGRPVAPSGLGRGEAGGTGRDR